MANKKEKKEEEKEKERETMTTSSTSRSGRTSTSTTTIDTTTTTTTTTKKKYRIVFIHLDLGIGGAEQLVLNLASSSYDEGHDVKIVTSRCDQDHCFSMVRKPDGKLCHDVIVTGRWIPSSLPMFHIGTAFFSTLRILWCTFYVLLWHDRRRRPRHHHHHHSHHHYSSDSTSSSSSSDSSSSDSSSSDSSSPDAVDVVVVDVLPTTIPLLAYFLRRAGVLFYCHFPDKFLTRDTVNGRPIIEDRSTMTSSNSQCQSSSSWFTIWTRYLRRRYRRVLDAWEEATMNDADVIVVNSEFTRRTVRDAFPSVRRRDLHILYPSIDFSKFVPPPSSSAIATDAIAATTATAKATTPTTPSKHVVDDEDENDDDDDDDDEDADYEKVMTTEEEEKRRRRKKKSLPPIISLNRFERKKNIGLLLEAYAILRDRYETKQNQQQQQQQQQQNDDDNNHNNNNNHNQVPSFELPSLTICGGYDVHNRENVEYLQELKRRAVELRLMDHHDDDIDDEIDDDENDVDTAAAAAKTIDETKTTKTDENALVMFRPNVSDEERSSLLQSCLCLVYTPHMEHFGIVPLEAMYAGRPVVALASGGPLETIRHEQTGFLCRVDDDDVDDDVDDIDTTKTKTKTKTTKTSNNTARDMADKLWRLCEEGPELSVRMGTAGHEHVRRTFGPSQFRTEWQRLLNMTIAIATERHGRKKTTTTTTTRRRRIRKGNTRTDRNECDDENDDENDRAHARRAVYDLVSTFAVLVVAIVIGRHVQPYITSIVRSVLARPDA